LLLQSVFGGGFLIWKSFYKTDLTSIQFLKDKEEIPEIVYSKLDKENVTYYTY